MAYQPQFERLLAQSSGIDFNATGDVATMPVPFARYIVTRLLLTNASATPGATLAMSLRDASGAGGSSLMTTTIAGLNTIITSSQGLVLSNLNGVSLTGLKEATASSLYLNVSVANGSSLIMTARVFGIPIL